jgi:hypothetical protein
MESRVTIDVLITAVNNLARRMLARTRRRHAHSNSDPGSGNHDAHRYADRSTPAGTPALRRQPVRRRPHAKFRGGVDVGLATRLAQLPRQWRSSPNAPGVIEGFRRRGTSDHGAGLHRPPPVIG